ncbi:MAG: porin family protein [Chitinophagaceae bacterium]
MKKIMIVPFVLLIGGFVSAQTFQFGPKAGINVSNFSSGYDNSSRIGVNLGGFVSFAAGKYFALQPEVVFSTEGAKLADARTQYKDLKVNYLNIPVLAQLRTNGGLYLETGPQVGLLLNAIRAKDGGDDETVKDLYNSIDWSWVFGVGFRSKFGLGLDARYNLGLTKLGKNINDFNTDAKTSVVQIGLFFAIGPH